MGHSPRNAPSRGNTGRAARFRQVGAPNDAFNNDVAETLALRHNINLVQVFDWMRDTGVDFSGDPLLWEIYGNLENTEAIKQDIIEGTTTLFDRLTA